MPDLRSRLLQQLEPSSSAHYAHPDGPIYRYIVLVFTCLLTFGSYFCFDQPSVLENQLQAAPYNLSDLEYNLLYLVYSWSNMIFVILGGWLIDRFGTRICALLFVTFITAGQLVFALGVSFNYYPVMLGGRILFGFGGGSISVVQNSICSLYFKGKELALAFSVALTTSRLGSVLNFFISSSLASATSVPDALWFGFALCIVSMLGALCFAFLDWNAERITKRIRDVKSRVVRPKDIKEFTLIYWLLCIICALFYAVVFSFMADASSLFQDKWGYDSNDASYIAGMGYDIALLISPFLGFLVDKFGQRGILVTIASAMLIVATSLLGMTSWSATPFIAMTIFGFAYSIAAASIWPTVALVVPLRVVGSALGIMTSIQMLGVGFWNLFVGLSNDCCGWDMVLMMLSGVPTDSKSGHHLAGTADFTVVMCVVLLYVDFRGSGTINKASTGKTAAQEYAEEEKRRLLGLNESTIEEEDDIMKVVEADKASKNNDIAYEENMWNPISKNGAETVN